MLERILSVAFPEQQAQLVKFIGSFSAKIEMFINDNMPMETLNFFVMNVFKKMCTPAERYRVASTDHVQGARVLDEIDEIDAAYHQLPTMAA